MRALPTGASHRKRTGGLYQDGGASPGDWTTAVWTFISVPQLMGLIAAKGIDAPLLLAIAVVAGPALFWSFIGLGYGMSALGWAAGIASTGILVSLTYASLAAASGGPGFTYWLFLTMIVACNLGAFCVMPYVLVRGTVGRR
ncbi:hypothetical protein [Streptomyces nigrescens]|uniref:hypothetical protein n=1 Tax=Streptomyces nigrescens TaxID=1920 RepID=UPI0036FD938D